MNSKWYFAKDIGPKDYLSDIGSELFRENSNDSSAFNGIAREMIQNAIDAKNPNLPKSTPVKVKFDFINIKKDEFPDVSGLTKHIQGTIDFCEEKGKKNIALSISKKQINKLKDEEFTVLKISDYNTTGVSGSDDLESGKSKWKSLIYNDGDTIKESTTSLGSFGLGKNAAFAMSSLNTVFFVTKDVKNNYAMEGVAKLYTSYVNNIKYMNEGYYCIEINGDTQPIDYSEAVTISPLFERETQGTDVIIVEPNISLIQDSAKWYLIEAIISNFFVAFLEGTLNVIVNGVDIHADSLNKIFKLLINRYISNGEDIPSNLLWLGQYLQVIDCGEDYSFDLAGFGEIQLKLYKDPSTKNKNVAIFRDRGMLIKHYSVKLATQKFAGVLIVRGKEGNEFLKSIEDPTHQDFDPSRESEDCSFSPSEKKRLLDSFYDAIKARVKKFTEIESDGSVTLIGMDDYIQMPDNSTGSNKLKTDVEVKHIKRNRKKEKEVIYVKTKAKEEGIGSEAANYEHNESKNTRRKNPIEPDTINKIKDNENGKMTLLKEHTVSFVISPALQIVDSKCVIIFKTNISNKNIKIKFKAIGEDGSENSLLPNIVRAYDANNQKELVVSRGVIEYIEEYSVSKLLIEFETSLVSRIKPYIYWEEIIQEGGSIDEEIKGL